MEKGFLGLLIERWQREPLASDKAELWKAIGEVVTNMPIQDFREEVKRVRNERTMNALIAVGLSSEKLRAVYRRRN